jgi:hypothetical protein
MRTFQDVKIMARTLREELSRREVALSHGECLDIVARQFGLGNWNVAAAKLGSATPLSAVPAIAKVATLPLPAGWVFEGSRLDYDVGVDVAMRRGSGHPALIRSFPGNDPNHTRTWNGLGALPGTRCCRLPGQAASVAGRS